MSEETNTQTLAQTVAATETKAPTAPVTQAANPIMTLAQLERLYILNALKATDGNKTKAAGMLGITIKTLYNKLHEYGEFENFATRSKAKPGTN